ncbi:hypothetical protein CPT03_06485 [Pedobacter ginsengisoli]|uniref:Uncharacterized protein n=1 Tax=Pedobacter ginsengisoli TaxID=363852 RepID=A0A2D1U3F2_9SPHI|nr:hypothetical protein [Pedobacter ginsengisoli]ATP56135.1 hypothetical protein CPT03_06485 [Pedobacter ginsengisoli]
MKLKKVDPSITYFGFITGLSIGIVVSILFTRTRTITIKEEQSSKQTNLIKTDEIADYLAYLGHRAEQDPLY